MLWSVMASSCFLSCPSIGFVCFWKAFPNGEYVNLACSIIFLWLEGNIFSAVRNYYLSIFSDDNADIFAVFLWIQYCNFSSLTLSSIVMINFYILSKRLYLRRKRLSDARVSSINKKVCFFSVHFYKDSRSI